MSDTKWTRGPWIALPRMGGYDVAGPSGEDIGYFNPSNGLDEPEHYPVQANAALAAASPDLYAALEKLLNGAVRYDEEPDSLVSRAALDEGISRARAALSRARGETT